MVACRPLTRELGRPSPQMLKFRFSNQSFVTNSAILLHPLRRSSASRKTTWLDLGHLVWQCREAGSLDGAVLGAATLDVGAVDSRSVLGGDLAAAGLFAALKVDVFEIEGMDVAREVAARLRSAAARADHPQGDSPQKGQTDVDEDICAAAGNHKHTKGRN